MIKVTSLHSRDALAKYLQKNVLQFSCDYFMVINDNATSYTDEELGITVTTTVPVAEEQYILLKSFTVPDSDINLSSDDFGHIEFKGVNYVSKMDISFYVPNKGKHVIQQFYDGQFSGGVPLFIPHSQLPAINIYRLSPPAQTTAKQALSTFTDASVFLEKLHQTVQVDPEPELLMSLYKCRFSRPKINPEVGSDNPITYSCTIYFEDFTIE